MIDNSLVKRAYEILIGRARDNETIFYGELYHLLGLNSNRKKDREIGSKILEEVNLKSGKEYMISAFAVSSYNNEPNEGFYKLALKWRRLTSWTGRYGFWINEMKRVHEKYK